MEQSGQSGPHSGAQVTQQAVGEGDDFLRIFPPTPAPLIRQPKRTYVDLVPHLAHLHGRIPNRLTGRTRAAGRAQTDSPDRRTRKVRLRPGTDRWRGNTRRIPPGQRELWQDFLRPLLDHP